MTEPKPPKKSDSLEVRLPYETKRAFMERCRQQGVTASDVVRGFIEDYLAASLPTFIDTVKTYIRPSLAAALVALAGAGTLLLAASPGSAWPDLRAAFAELDGNGDGSISQGEFLTRTRMDTFVKRPAAEDAAAPARPFMLPIDGPPEALPGMSVTPASPDRLTQEFASLDQDRSASVSFAEFEGRHKAIAAQAFTSLDKNGDGLIEKAEYEIATVGREPVRGIFAALDADRDGSVSADEFVNAD